MTIEVHAEERMLPLGQSTLGRLKMCLLPEAVPEVIGPLYEYGRTCFGVNKKEGRKYGCFPVIVPYGCDILQGNEILGVKHEVAVCAPCTRCLSTVERIRNLGCGRTRALLEIKKARKYSKMRTGGGLG